MTAQDVGDRWWAGLIKIERSNNQTPSDTTPANAVEVRTAPSCDKDGHYQSSRGQDQPGVDRGVRLCPLLPPTHTHTLHTPLYPVVFDSHTHTHTRTSLISRHTTEEKGGVSGNRKESFIFS